MSTAQFWFNFNCAFSGQKIYVEWAIQFFNLFYTSVPIILLGAYDRDISKQSCRSFPKDYSSCIRGEYFNTSIFWGWIGVAIVESVLCSVLPYYFLDNASPKTGTLATFWEAGATCLTVIILVCNFKVRPFSPLPPLCLMRIPVFSQLLSPPPLSSQRYCFCKAGSTGSPLPLSPRPSPFGSSPCS